MNLPVTGLANAYITAKMGSVKKVIVSTAGSSREAYIIGLRRFVKTHPYYKKMMDKSDYTEKAILDKIYGC